MRALWATAMICGFVALATAGEGDGVKTYGCGILGNCCTHGAGLCGMFKNHPRTRVVAAYEADPRRAAAR